MMQILEPSVTDCQGLTVLFSRSKLGRMEKNQELNEFSHRLNDLCEEKGIAYWGRQVAIGKIFGVSQKGARKWLEAESWPRMETLIKISAWADVSIDWLISGRGDKRKSQNYASEPISHVLTVMENMTPEQQYLLARLADQVAQPISNHDNEFSQPKKSEQ